MKRILQSPHMVASPSKRLCSVGADSNTKKRPSRLLTSSNIQNLDQWLDMFELWTAEERKIALDHLVDRSVELHQTFLGCHHFVFCLDAMQHCRDIC